MALPDFFVENDMNMKKIDLVSITACIIMLISVIIPYFISFKTSRIAFGTPVSAKECFGEYYVVLFVIILFFFIMSFVKKDKKLWNFVTGLVAAVSLALFVWSVSARYESLPYDVSGSARMSFGVGYLIVVAALYSIMLKCCQYLKSTLRMIINLIAWGLIAWFLVRGFLNNYAVMQEFLAAKGQFFQNVWQHLKLSIEVLIASIVIGFPIGYLCYKNKALDTVTLIGISIVETIPTLALFAIMRIPLAYLKDTFPVLERWGIGSFGTAPAFAALLLYALYLIIHNSRAAFSTIDKTLIENAYAMGMTSIEVFVKVQIPMAMPVLLSGIRMTLVSTLVAATLASYIGGGGLGVYIVNGINALSIDMQLLGVIPIFVLTVTADYGTRFLFRFIMPGKRADNYDFVEGRI